MHYDLLTILGPTASGKTPLAVAVALRLKGEILSADSRQVYRGMDIGTGKDLCEFQTTDGRSVPYHLIDIADVGEKYNVHAYQQDFLTAYNSIRQRGNTPILCGGTGLYLEAVLKGYRLLTVPQNPTLREQLSAYSLAELTEKLSTYKTLHNHTDVDTAQRAIRAIEIAEYQREHESEEIPFPTLRSLIIGVNIDRALRREKISRRLHERLEQGMVEEVRSLLDSGITPEDLLYYGLEYKYLTQYVLGEISYETMLKDLEIAIHQFAKRQMTWFRGMERKGFHIHWIDATLSMEDKVERILTLWSSKHTTN